MFRFFFLIAAILFPSISYSSSRVAHPVEPNTYYVSGKTTGQLGNQMFCIATTLAYAWDHNLTPIFPFLNSANANRSYNRDHIFFRLDTTTPSPTVMSVYRDRELNYKPIPPFRDVVLEGPFFSWKYFDHHREKILALFAPSEKVLNYLNKKYEELISAPNTVAIHVRTTSPQVHRVAFPFPGLNYFALAIEQFSDDSIFVVFSDRINWCKKNFSERFPDKTFVFIEGNDHIEDLFLMSMMKHHILSNLTYSWWGAYLNQNPDQIVYVPERQAYDERSWPIEDFYLPEWKIIPYDFTKDPYPNDMFNYDKKSQSLYE